MKRAVAYLTIGLAVALTYLSAIAQVSRADLALAASCGHSARTSEDYCLSVGLKFAKRARAAGFPHVATYTVCQLVELAGTAYGAASLIGKAHDSERWTDERSLTYSTLRLVTLHCPMFADEALDKIHAMHRASQ